MSKTAVNRVLDKRIGSDSREEYLVDRTTNGKPTHEWISRKDMPAECQQLMDDYNKTPKSNGCADGKVTTNGINTESDDKVAKEGVEEAAEEPLNGFDRGFRPFKILGAKEDNGLKFLVMFREDLTKADLIPNHVLHQKCPQLLIKYYEKNTLWKRH